MDNRQQELSELILKLALPPVLKDNNTINEQIKKLQAVYSDDFRHYYSEVFGMLTVIKNVTFKSLENFFKTDMSF